jgi:hypothetical protein
VAGEIADAVTKVAVHKTAPIGLPALKEKKKKVVRHAMKEVLARSVLNRALVQSVRTVNNAPNKARRGKEMLRVAIVHRKN